MQQKWRLDVDKLTFIICLPPPREIPSDGCILPGQDDAADRILGDVNLFICEDESEECGKAHTRMVGEIEIMIAKKERRGEGLGQAALTLFLHYVFKNREEIMKAQFGPSGVPDGVSLPTLSALRVKINQTNTPSIKLFEKLGFVKRSGEPNYFGELELVLQEMSIEPMVKSAKLDGWREVGYENNPYLVLRSICCWF